MVDLQTVSMVTASASVVAGVIYYGLQLRHQNKIRQTDLIARLFSTFISDDFQIALLKTMNLEFEDYKDFVKKYGSFSLETPVNVAVRKIVYYYSQVGTLLHRGLVGADLVYEFMGGVTMIWNKLEPLIEGHREHAGYNFGMWFEYLCDELKKREQQLTSKTA